MTISIVSGLMGKVTGDKWVEQEVSSYFLAQDRVLDQELHGFIRGVYRQGLVELHNRSKSRGMSGIFSLTHLRGFTTAGRIMLTFARISNEGIDTNSVSFVGDESDEYGFRFGTQSVYAPLEIASSMIRDVVDNWPSDPKERAIVYKSDKNVSIL
jgi:hypothetical protein